jgi:type VI secretion system secreted protein Hcp
MALNAYLKVKGASQGDIKGSVTQKGREHQIAVHSYHHHILSPRDAASGQASGKRQHGAFTIVKETDKSTPLLHKALSTNEKFKTWELRCFTPKSASSTGSGQETNHFTIVLTDAVLTGMLSIMENNLMPENTKLPLMEEVSFTYSKISWMWEDGGITHEDTWSHSE